MLAGVIDQNTSLTDIDLSDNYLGGQEARKKYIYCSLKNSLTTNDIFIFLPCFFPPVVSCSFRFVFVSLSHFCVSALVLIVIFQVSYFRVHSLSLFAVVLSTIIFLGLPGPFTSFGQTPTLPPSPLGYAYRKTYREEYSQKDFWCHSGVRSILFVRSHVSASSRPPPPPPPPHA